MPPSRAADWLAELAEAVAGKRLNEESVLETVDSEGLETLRTETLRNESGDFYARWGRWFFANAVQRTVSAFSSYSVMQYVEGLIEENSTPSLREALLLAPTNAVAGARMAVRLISSPSAPASSATYSEADFLSREALRLAPNNNEVIRARNEVLKRLEKP